MAKITKQANQPMTNKMKVRLNRIVAIAMSVMVLYVGGNLVNASIINADFYQNYASNQQMSSQTITAKRGTIYSTNMEILAKSATVWDVILAPAVITNDKLYVEIGAIPEGGEEQLAKQLQSLFGLSSHEKILASLKSEKRFALIRTNMTEAEQAAAQGFIDAGHSYVMFAKEAVAKGLSDILEMDYETVLEKTYQDNQYEIVEKKVEKQVADQIRTMITESSFTFITLLENSKRYYPNNELASDIIGFTGSDNQGVYGVELQYDSYLQGTDGKLMTATDAQGNPIPTSYEQTYDAVDGDSIVLTIDENIQRMAENYLSEMIELHEPENGGLVIVMDIKTGAILAMADSENYDPNNPSVIYSDRLQAAYEEADTSTDELEAQAKQTIRAEQWKNNAIQLLYEPGSTFKIVTASSALEAGTSTISDTFHCPGHYTVGGEIMYCNERDGHGTIDFKNAIVKSCNPSFIQIGLNLGVSKFSAYFEEFGLTEPTGIDLPGESQTSLYVSESNMGQVELASTSFGQTAALTPIQVITAESAGVNGGYLVQPHVLKEVLDENGNVIQTNSPDTKRQVISEETSAIMRDALEEMVESSNAYQKGYRIAGKSGTSQKGNSSANGYVASFITFAPADDPEFAVLMLADKPTGSTFYGNTVVGPFIGSLTAEILSYRGYAPEYTEEDLASMNISVPTVIGDSVSTAQTRLKNSSLDYVVVGDGDTVIDQMPRSSSIAAGGKVILYTEDNTEPETTEVPDIVGKGLVEANQLITDAGLTINLNGNPSQGQDVVITFQKLKAGDKVPVGTVVNVNYGTILND